MTEQKLTKLLKKGDDQRCVAFFKDMSENQRRELAPYCQQWYENLNEAAWIQINATTYRRNPLFTAAEVAMFATATFAEIKGRPFHTRPTDEHVCQLLIDRHPKWVSDWVPTLLEEPNYWSRWSLIRHLINAGLAKKPDHPNYYLGMISGLRDRFRDGESIEQALLDDPKLLEDEVWRLFEYDGAGENSLANWDRFTGGQTWQEALIHLAEQGHLPRRRLLECAMEALERDFNHYRAKWYATFYDALQPSADEQREHADRYLGLLSVSAPNIVTWAFAKVEAAHKEGLYASDSLVAGVQPVLEARSKGIVKKAIRLLKRLTKSDPNSSQAVCEAMVVALGHEASDVQEAALNVIEQTLDPDQNRLTTRLADYQDIVAPSLRKRVQKLNGVTGTATDTASTKTPPAGTASIDISTCDPEIRARFGIDALAENLKQQRLEIPAATFHGMDIPRLKLQTELTPIDNLDDLIDTCARVVEDESRIDDAELAMDALARLGDQKGDDFQARVAPLLKRVRQKLKRHAAPFIGFGPSQDLFGLVYAWGNGEVIRTKNGKRHRNSVSVIFEGKSHDWYMPGQRPTSILSRRSLALAEQLAEGKATVLLSAPTHSGGWIDPRVLVQRANEWRGSDPDLTDVCLALLRCAPDFREEALAQLGNSSSEWVRAIRHALGGQRVRLGKTESLWAAAARARAPWEDDTRVAKAFPNLGPDGASAATYTFECKKVRKENAKLKIKSQPSVPKKVQLDSVTVLWHGHLGSDVWSRSAISVDWAATIWPQARESFFATAANELASNLDWWEADWGNKDFLKPLLDPGTPLREMGLLLLVVGLAAKEPGEHGLAIDAAICAIEDGRLGSDNLGAMLARILPTGLVMPPRWAKTLGEIARISPVHAAVVHGALQHSFRGDPSKMPRNYAKLLELAHELSIELEQGIDDELARDFLASIKGSSKAAKVAKTLLSLPSDESFKVSGAILEQAMRQRLERRLS